mmetsp:Transcript_9523/g.43384  ORF Transcript_9523/g.43384 Transcript_9523/m.43384 type:complete len:270 (+) Transcript_9523:1398-2207(+)
MDTVTPVGVCVMRTALFVVLTCCPPAPDARIVSIFKSSSLITRSTSSACGNTATLAVDVCTRPCVSVAGTRCTRCTPDSNFRRPYTSSPANDAVTSLYPPVSDAFVATSSNRHPFFLANISYMRRRSAAKSAASSPPAPARTSRMTPASSASSAGRSKCASVCSNWGSDSSSTSSSSFAICAISASDADSAMTVSSDAISSRCSLTDAYARTTRSARASSLLMRAMSEDFGGGSATSDARSSSCRAAMAFNRRSSAGVITDDDDAAFRE